MIFYSGMYQSKQAQNCGLVLAELSCTSFQDVEAKSQEEWHSIEDSACHKISYFGSMVALKLNYNNISVTIPR